MSDPAGPRRYPVLFQLNARTIVRRLGAASLDALDDDVLDRLVPRSVDWLYLLGVWQTGAAGREVSRTQPDIRRDCEASLPDLTDDDICGSSFAVTGYRVHERLGGDGALDRLRARLARRGISLMLDFVPNHTAPDHPWVREHPDFFVHGTQADLDAAPHNWTRVSSSTDGPILAYGRDPFFPGWPDTLQLDYANADVRSAMTVELLRAASRCDGLRCDMAMLLLPDVFARTWGREMAPFWPNALAALRAEHRGFTCMAEVYWDREFDLQQQGFAFTYDKRLYDRLLADLPGVRGHLRADPDYQARSARFLENHDEPRAAATFGTGERQRASAVVTYLCPGLRFFQHGQLDGWRTHVPVHLCRAPVEADDADLASFYAGLLEVLDDPALHDGTWRLLGSRAAWEGNDSHSDVIAYAWTSTSGSLRCISVANLAEHRSQAYLDLSDGDLRGLVVDLHDRLGPEQYERSGDELAERGLYVDVAPWAHNIFEVSTRQPPP